MLISIVVTSYNYQEYIKDTINSILNQTCSDWEMIVVDDASTDLSVEVIREFAKNDSRIKLIVNETNIGLAKSLQKGVETASGEWIAFLESDDMWTCDNLQKKADIIAKYPDIALIFNDVELFGDENRIKDIEKIFVKSALHLKQKTYPYNLFRDLLFFNRVLTFSTVFVNRKKLMECNFNTPTDKLADWWFLIHFAQENEFFYIPEKLTRWRIHKDSYIYKKENTYSYPINVLSLIDIIKNEKKYKYAIYLLPVLISSAYRLRVGLIQHLKVKLGIPLRGASR